MSNSSRDNVEHLYTLNLAPGKYDLQVLKNGGHLGTANVFSNSEIYGLAWNAANQTAMNNLTNLQFSQSMSVTISTTIMGAGTLTHLGSGTTTLASYQGTGPINVSNGQLGLTNTNGRVDV